MANCYIIFAHFFANTLLITLFATNNHSAFSTEQFSTVRVRIDEEGFQFFSKIAHYIVRLPFISFSFRSVIINN